jgi:hypothetical protein
LIVRIFANLVWLSTPVSDGGGANGLSFGGFMKMNFNLDIMLTPVAVVALIPTSNVLVKSGEVAVILTIFSPISKAKIESLFS